MIPVHVPPAAATGSGSIKNCDCAPQAIRKRHKKPKGKKLHFSAVRNGGSSLQQSCGSHDAGQGSPRPMRVVLREKVVELCSFIVERPIRTANHSGTPRAVSADVRSERDAITAASRPSSSEHNRKERSELSTYSFIQFLRGWK